MDSVPARAARALVALLACLATSLALCMMSATSLAKASQGGLVLVPIGTPPLSDAKAAKLVGPADWEPRPTNSADNSRVPTAAQLAAFHRQNTEPYSKWVTGDYWGTTDQIIQWAAAKWGLNPDLLRAVAAVETWWYMSFAGNEGSSFGLFQVRTPYHCRGPLVCGLFQHDTAFNADYYCSIIRSYYDGVQTWLNSVSGNAQPYRAGDLWGAVGYWAAGRWHVPAAEAYVAHVKRDLAERVWAQPYFVGR
jgi:autotransporter family porin